MTAGPSDAELLRRLHNARHYAATTADWRSAERWIVTLADLSAEARARGLIR